MSSPLSIKPKKQETAGCCCFGKPKKKHEETKEKVAEVAAQRDDLPIAEIFDAEKIRAMSDDEIADMLNSKHKRMPTPYPRDQKK